MATTDVDICNMALILMDNADNYITALTDATKEARAFSLCYSHVRAIVLEAFPWSFAAKRAKITVDSTAPAFQYAYRYVYPSDCVALRRVSDGETFTYPVDYKIEAGYILCDVPGSLYVEYTYLHSTPANYPERFIQALAARLAAYTAGSIMGASPAKIQLLMAAYKQILAEAHRIDAVEDSSKQAGIADLVSIR